MSWHWQSWWQPRQNWLQSTEDYSTTAEVKAIPALIKKIQKQQVYKISVYLFLKFGKNIFGRSSPPKGRLGE
jgi:hypothetical protein